MKTPLCIALAFGALAAAHAAGPAGLPPPGQYRIDSESTTTSRAGPTTLEHVLRTDGATGRVTTTQKSSVDPGRVATQSVAGAGPNGWCVPAHGGVPPPRMPPSACPYAVLSRAPSGATLGADCNFGRMDEQWRRIDDRTWQRSLVIRQTPPGATVASPRAAIEFAMRGMTPEQRARAQAELAGLPTDAQMAEARGTLIATLEQAARSGNAEEAALARQQLSAMGASPGGESLVTVRVEERWTRIAESCRAGG